MTFRFSSYPPLVLLLLNLVQSVNSQTIESQFEDCFGSGMDPQSPVRVRTFGVISAHLYRTQPEGMELVTRVKPYSCIYGFLFPTNPKVDHLLFNLQNVYLREGVNTYLGSRIHVAFHIFQYVNNETFRLATVHLKPPEERLHEIMLRVHRSQLKSGPVLISMDHTVPRGVHGLRFLHMSLLVTPIFSCHIKEILMNNRLTRSTIKQNKGATEMEERKQTFFACTPYKTNDSSVDPYHQTTFCITADLMCDHYPNCPRDAEFNAVDEDESQCPILAAISTQYLLWVTPLFVLPSVLLFSMVFMWVYRSRQFAWCRRILLKQHTSSSEECPSPIACQRAPRLEEMLLIGRRRQADDLVASMSSCPPPPPPSYQEAMQQLFSPECPSVQSVSLPRNQELPENVTSHRSDFLPSNFPSQQYPITTSEAELNRYWISPSTDIGRISIASTSPPPPSYNFCISTDVRSASVNRTACSSLAQSWRTR